MSWLVCNVIVLVLLVPAVTEDRNSTFLCIGDNCDRPLEASAAKAGDRTVVVSRHQDKCTAEEAKEAACLSGECFAVYLGYARALFCRCDALYQGSRCEQICAECLTRAMRERGVQSAEISVGVLIGVVVVAVLIIGILIVVIVVLARKLQDEKDSPEKNGSKPDKVDDLLTTDVNGES